MNAEDYISREMVRLHLANLFHKMRSSDFVQKVVETYATRLLLIGIGLLTSVIVARILGPRGRCLYAVAMTVAAVGVQFGNLGLHASNTYCVAKNRECLPALVGNSLLLSVLLGSAAGFAAWGVFFVWPDLAPVHGGLLVLALAWVPLGLAYLMLQNLLIGIHRIREYNKAEVGNKICSVTLIGVVIAVHAVRVETVFLASLAALGGSLAWIAWRLGSQIRFSPAVSLPLFRENLAFGVKAYIAAIFAFIVLRSDLLLIQYLLGPEQVGYYSIAVAMADLIYMLPVVIGTILFPRLSGMESEEKKWESARLVARYVAVSMVLVGSAASLVAGPLVRILYGKPFLPAVPAFVWLMPGIVMLSVNTIYMNYFASTGMPPITIYSPAAAAMLNVGLNFVLIPSHGIVGASLSSVAAYGIMLAASIFYLRYGGGRVPA
jgi:O-antigen/teichoic acid export membrane protein